MKREYVKPESEALIPEGEKIMEDVPFSPGGYFEANTGNFELDEEVGDKPASFSLWDTNEN